jgi:hypothetical protein
MAGRTSEDGETTLGRETWDGFCELLKKAGDAIWETDLARSDFDRAEGARYLSRLLRAGLVSFVENAGPTHPVFRPMPDQVKMGLDNPDNYYLNASIQGRYDYRIRGRRGTIHYLSFAAQNQNFAARDRITGGAGHLNASELALGPDGSFEIIASQREQGGNWLPLAPDTKQILVRQTFLDRLSERPVEVEIECLGAGPEAPPKASSVKGRAIAGDLGVDVDPARIGGQLSGAALYAIGCARWFADWVASFESMAPMNRFHLPEPDQHRFVGGDPNIQTWLGRWQLGADEALLIEATPPDCAYWNFQLGNVWAESLDYRFHRVHVNSGQAVYENDGSFRLVVAHRDPGMPNWIETAGHDHGTMLLRWVLADRHPEPLCRVVSVDSL